MKHLTCVLSFFFVVIAQAASLSNSGVEVDYTYTTEFRSFLRLSDVDFNYDTPAQLASFHAAHVFGLFHSPEYAKKFGYAPELIEGFAGTKAPTIQKAEYIGVEGDDYLWIRYEAKGQMLVLKNVAAQWFNGKTSTTVTLPLLRDLPAIYDDFGTDYRNDHWIKCTDSYYQSATDFSYFYNPFRCPSLGRHPIAQDVTFKLKLTPRRSEEKVRFPHQQIYSDNQNGPLTVLYFAQGFDHAPEAGSSPQKIRSDIGYRVFRKLEIALIDEYGFQAVEGVAELRTLLGENMQYLNLATPVHQTHYNNRTFFRTFYKKDGEKIFVVRAALLNSEYEARKRGAVSFIKFWKEAWENGDFIYFGGHSGDGASLDVGSINGELIARGLAKDTILSSVSADDLSGIRFSQNKTQVAFIDACSSYDHYQEMYREHKPKNLHLMTYGLVSLFHNAEATIRYMLRLILHPAKTQPLWQDVLLELEKDQLTSHVTNLYYDQKTAQRELQKFKKSGQLPSYLLNVSVPQ